MANNTVNFQINVGGNAYTGIAQIDKAMGNLLVNAKKSTSFFENLKQTAFNFNLVTDAVKNLNGMIANSIQSGVDFDKSLHELSAIAQVTGKPLEEIGQKARNLAKTFGGEASQYVESFKDVIGSLGDTFSDSTALDMMGKNIGTLSKLMGGDAKAAADALSTAMLQYGVDLNNPIEASREATRMMNVMQAAANVGGSEVSDTAQALRQSGLLAKQSGLSFEELNASLEGLAKGKIVAGEAGTAMRNILLSMSTLGNSSKEVTAGLKKYGVNVDLVTNSSVKFTDRLREMSKIQGDAGLMEGVFMKANIAAGQTILNNIDTIDQWTDAVTGTNAAVEGAATVMESYAERQARMRAQFEDLKISLFNVTGEYGIWAEVLAGSLIPVAQIIPLLSGIGSAFAWIKNLQIGASIMGAVGSVRVLNMYLAGGELVAVGFGQKMLQACVAVVRFATVGIWNAVKGVGALIVSLVTGGTTSATFAAISSGAFATFSTAASIACKAVTIAIGAIPIIGWIAIAITAIAGLFVYLYNKFDKFRAYMNGIGAVLKAIFTLDFKNIGTAFDTAFNDTLKRTKEQIADGAAIKPNADGLVEAPAGFAGAPAGFAWNYGQKPESSVYQFGNDGKSAAKSAVVGDGLSGTVSVKPTSAISDSLSGTGSKAAGDNKIKNINITIDRVIEKFEVHTTHLKESTGRIKDMVAQAIIEGVNDVNLAF